MFKNGDTVIAKSKFLIKFSVPIEKRNLTITEYDGEYSKLMYNNEEIIAGTGFLTNEYFHIPSSVNYEISRLIEDDNIEFKSFSGVTLDGKVIQIDSTYK